MKVTTTWFKILDSNPSTKTSGHLKPILEGFISNQILLTSSQYGKEIDPHFAQSINFTS